MGFGVLGLPPEVLGRMVGDWVQRREAQTQNLEAQTRNLEAQTQNLETQTQRLGAQTHKLPKVAQSDGGLGLGFEVLRRLGREGGWASGFCGCPPRFWARVSARGSSGGGVGGR